MNSIKSAAIVWARFGPYHLARLRETAAYYRLRGVTVHGIEVARRDSTYAWDLIGDEVTFPRHTLFDACYTDLSLRKIWKEMRAILNKIDPDAVAINGWAAPEALASLQWCHQHKRVAVLMSESWRGDKPRFWWKEFLKTYIVRYFDSALVGGRPHAEYVAGLGIPLERVFWGYDVVDNDYFRMGAYSARGNALDLRHKHHLPEHYFYVNTRFLPRKNLDGLLYAYARYLRKASSPWSLVITGDGVERNHLLMLCEKMPLPTFCIQEFGGKGFPSEQLGQDPAVYWHGFIQYHDLPIYYGLASAFVHPAKFEQWGLVINEAAAAGLPLLVSNSVGAQFELLQEEGNGYAFDPFNPDDIALTLLRMSNLDQQIRTQMGIRSQTIVDSYGLERFADSLNLAIESALFMSVNK